MPVNRFNRLEKYFLKIQHILQNKICHVNVNFVLKITYIYIYIYIYTQVYIYIYAYTYRYEHTHLCHICISLSPSPAHSSVTNGNNEREGIFSRPLVITDLIMSSLCRKANVMMMFQKCYEPLRHSYKTPSVGLCFGLRSHLATGEDIMSDACNVRIKAM